MSSYKFQQIKPLKARGLLKESMWNDPLWVAERKYDGDRRIAQLLHNRVRFTGTRESVDGTGYVEKSDNIPHLSLPKDPSSDVLQSLQGTVLDGEIVSPNTVKGGQSKAVTSIMGSSPEKAIAKQKATGWLRYVVFDCLYYKGQDVRGQIFAERRKLAIQAVKEWDNQHVEVARGLATAKREYFDQIIKEGGEGVILKHRDQRYGDEKLWVKVKGEWTADVIITGFKPGKGKYKGMVGSVRISQYDGQVYKTNLRTVGFARGFSDALMVGFTNRPRKHLNKVIEIAHNGREPTGAFRHPRFKRFRPDKNPKDCVYREGEI